MLEVQRQLLEFQSKFQGIPIRMKNHTKSATQEFQTFPRETFGIPTKCEAINNRTTKQCWESKGNCWNANGIPRTSNQNEESYEKCNSGIPKETFGIPRKCEATDNRSTKQCWESKGSWRNSTGIPMNSNHTEESHENQCVRKSVKCFWRQRILFVALVSIKIWRNEHSLPLLAPTFLSLTMLIQAQILRAPTFLTM